MLDKIRMVFLFSVFFSVFFASACKSKPESIAAPQEKVPEGEPCIAVYSQEEIDEEFRKIRRLENRRDFPDDATFANFREIKSTGIQPGVLYRSSHPAMPVTTAPYAARLAEQAKIFTILNLSDTRTEMTNFASALPWYQSYLNRDAMTALFTGDDFFASFFGDKLRTGIQYMLHRRGPFLIHCVDGIEKTGFVIIVFQALMGASPEEITEEYMKSYYNYYGFSEDGSKIISQIPQNFMCALNEGRLVTQANLPLAAEKYLLNTAGLDPASIAELKRVLAVR